MKQIETYTANRDIEALRRALAEGEVELVFVKRNERYRVARATRCLELIPDSDRPKGTTRRRESDTAMAFYDLDKGAWRSFRIDYLLDFKPN